MNQSSCISKATFLILFSLLLFTQNFYSQSDEWINYTYTEDIYSIAGIEDTLWLATSGGLVKFNIQTKEKEYYNVSNSNLINNQVNPIAVDSLGNVWMWISFKRYICFPNKSKEYLVKFNGTNLEYFSPPIDICKTWGLLPRIIEVDKNNEIWIGTYRNGLLNFNGKRWNIYDTANTKMPTNNIEDIAIDKDNNKWMTSREIKGLIKFDGNGFSIYDSLNSDLPNSYFINIEVDKTGKLWLTTFVEILTYVDDSLQIISTIIPDDTFIESGCFKIDNEGNPWILQHELYCFSNNNWHSFNQQSTQYYYWNVFYIDKNNNKWLSTKKTTKEGYTDYDKGGLTKFADDKWEINTLGNSKIMGGSVGTLFKDANNTMWLFSGILNKISNNNWEHYLSTNDLFEISNVRSITEDNNGNLWLGTYNRGLIKFDGNNWEYFTTENSELPNDIIGDIIVDLNENLWFTSDWQLGIVKYDGTNFTVYDTTNSGLPTNWIQQIETDSKGNLWFGTATEGLVKYDFNSWTIYNTQIKWNEITSLYIDNEDCIWIGGFGLTKFQNGSWSYYEHDDSIEYYMNYVMDIAKDEENNIWLAASYGIYKFDGEHFTKFDHSNAGLPDEVFSQIEFDQYDNLWIGTSSGVILYKEGGVVTNIENISSDNLINDFILFQNYPNPFNPTTTIKYCIPSKVKSETANVKLVVYDILGRENATLVNQKQKPGNYEVIWNASNQPSGVYFYQLTAGTSTSSANNYVETKKMVLLK